jgi:amino acid transporter
MTEPALGGASAQNEGRERHAEDAAQLLALGYKPHFRREMRLRDNLALGFTYLSPLVGIYILFAFAIDQVGPPAIWALVLAGAGQMLVALVFGEIVSQFPIAGGVYPWARRLWGRRYAWMTGWVYAWALLVTLGSVAFGVAPISASFFGVSNTYGWSIGSALVLVALAGLVNFTGTRNLGRLALFGFLAELIGVIGISLYLMLFHAKRSPAVVFDSFGAVEGTTWVGAFLFGALIGIWQFYGFEACGDVAEEVSNPGRQIPKAMRLTILVGGATAMMLFLAFAMSVPNLTAATTGQDADPIGSIFTSAFGTFGSKLFLGIALISFLAVMLSMQASVSRMIYAYARDRMIFGSRILGKFDDRRGIPPMALTVAVVVPVALVFIFASSADALAKITSFAALGIYITFQLVVFAALIARLRGWRPAGTWTLGRWGLPVNVAALLYGISAAVNLAWPRTPDVPWYDNYIVLLGAGVVIGAGLLFMTVAKPYRHSSDPEADAIEVANRIRSLRQRSAVERAEEVGG